MGGGMGYVGDKLIGFGTLVIAISTLILLSTCSGIKKDRENRQNQKDRMSL